MTDPTRDPALAEALRDLRPDAPHGEVDWDALRGRIRDDAALPLARLRRRGTVHRAARVLVPLATAAGIAAVALGRLPGGGPAPLAAEDSAVVDEILELSVPEPVGLLLSGEAAEVALLEAVGGDG